MMVSKLAERLTKAAREQEKAWRVGRPDTWDLKALDLMKLLDEAVQVLKGSGVA